MDLRFQTIAIKEFEFLMHKYSFKCVQSDSCKIQYESDAVFVTVHFDENRSYELGCELGRMDDSEGSLECPFDLGEIIRWKELSQKDIHTAFQVTNIEDLQKFCQLLASHLQCYAHELLIGTESAFKTLADFRDKECVEYALARDLEIMRDQLEDIWQTKNYNKVIELLSPLKKHLKHSEIKKLEYALRHEKV